MSSSGIGERFSKKRFRLCKVSRHFVGQTPDFIRGEICKIEITAREDIRIAVPPKGIEIRMGMEGAPNVVVV